MLLVTALAALGLLATTSPAWAHTELVSSDPAQGASLAAAPTQIRLTFGEAVTLPSDPISVTGPDGAKWTVGAATIAGAVVTAPVTPSGPAGKYTVAYKVIADDGDQVAGTVVFSLAASATPPIPAAPTPAEAPAASQPVPAPESGVPFGLWIVVGLVVVGGAGLVVARSRRRG
jgi:hypothetical protein